MKKIVTPILILSLMLSAISPIQDVEAATKITLSSTKLNMKVGAVKTVKANKVVKWKSSNKKIASVKKISAKKAKITAKKAGSCKIIATAGNKKAAIRVNIKKKTVTTTKKPKVTITPINTPVSTPEQMVTSVVPTASVNPTWNGSITVSPEPTKTSVVTTVEPTVEPTITTPEPTKVPMAATLEPTATVTDVTQKPIVTSIVETPEPTISSIVETPEPTISSIVETPEPTTSSIAETPEPTISSIVEIPEPTISSIVETPEPTETSIVKTPEPTATPVTTPVTVTGSGLSMILDSYEEGKITYTIKNQSNSDIQYSYGYFLEREINGEWVSVVPDRNIQIPMAYVSVLSGEDVCLTTNIKAAYDLEQGNYRFVKNLYFKDWKEVVSLALPFEVTNTVVFNDGISMTLDSYADSVITFTITNESGNEIGYSYDDYYLQKEIDGEWITMEPVRLFPIRNLYFPLDSGESDTQTVNLAIGYDLQAGNYRFVKSFVNQIELALPFKVIE